jgi:fatty-acyl-CoA synthase/long-chain acyl-CoA synthetase
MRAGPANHKGGHMVDFASVADVRKIETDLPWPDSQPGVTIYDLLGARKTQHGHLNAISFQMFSGPKDAAETLTWNDLHARVTQAANLFRSLGIGPQDTVAFVLPNCNETVVTLLGGAVAGIVAPINPLLEPTQIAAILRETKARIVVTLRAFPKTDLAQKVAAALAETPDVHTVLEVDLLRYLTGAKRLIVPMIRPKNRVTHKARVLNFNAELARHAKTLTFEDIKTDRVAAYFHTGGTTGMPKVAQHRYSGMIYNGWIGTTLLFTEKDTVICPLPLFHVFASHVILMSMLVSGGHVVFPTPQGYRGDGVFDHFWKLIERWQVTFIITVPTAIAAMMQRPVNADISSVKTAFSGSSPLPVELFHRFEKATGITLVEGYGLTEATCLVACNPVHGDKKIGSVGVAFPHTNLRILKTIGGQVTECATDEVGEICIHSPGVFDPETYTDQDKNRTLYHDGVFLRTGDLGRVDHDGYIWITGRAKDLIVRGGHNIDPAMIEECLATHPDIAMAGAIGQPDAFAGELPCAYVELTQGATTTAKDLREWCKTRIPERAAIPKYIEILDELPKTAVGKIFKPDLRKRAITRIYNAALAKAGIDANVHDVYEDPKRGLVARIAGDHAAAGDIGRVLGEFTIAWAMK